MNFMIETGFIILALLLLSNSEKENIGDRRKIENKAPPQECSMPHRHHHTITFIFIPSKANETKNSNC